MILNDVVQIGCGHLKEVGMEILIPETRFMHSDRRPQQLNIPNA
jgi:hypothetical protein